MIGFGAGWAGAIGAVCGILACIGSSILMCCAPKTPQEGGGKFCAVRKSTPLAATPNPTPYAARAGKQNCALPAAQAAVLLLIGGIIQLIMFVTLLGLLIAAVTSPSPLPTSCGEGCEMGFRFFVVIVFLITIPFFLVAGAPPRMCIHMHDMYVRAYLLVV